MIKQLRYFILLCLIVPLQAQEFGTDDFLITHCVGIGDATYNTSRPKSAYNSTDDNYIITGQLLDANGNLIGTNHFPNWRYSNQFIHYK